MTRSIILICLLVLLAAVSVKAQKTSVTVTVVVQDVLSSKGQLRLAVFNSEEKFLKNEIRAMVIDLEKTKSHIFEIKDLPVGTYAISVIHDENKNKVLDMGVMGPEEGYGFSNNVRGMFGPAPYHKASMNIKRDTRTTIKLL